MPNHTKRQLFCCKIFVTKINNETTVPSDAKGIKETAAPLKFRRTQRNDGSGSESRRAGYRRSPSWALGTRPIRSMLSILNALNNHLPRPLNTFPRPPDDNRIIALPFLRNIDHTPGLIPNNTNLNSTFPNHQMMKFRRNTKVSRTIPLITHARNKTLEMVFGFGDVEFVGTAEFPGNGFGVGVCGFFLDAPRIGGVVSVAVDTGQ